MITNVDDLELNKDTGLPVKSLKSYEHGVQERSIEHKIAFEKKHNPYFVKVCVPVSYEENAWIDTECPFDPCKSCNFH